MQKNKLIHLFKSLSRQEIQAFGKYLDRAKLPQKEKIIALYNYLKENIRKIEPTNFDKDYVFQHIIPTTTAQRSISRERILMSDLCLLLEDFWVQQELKAAPIQRNNLLADAFQKHRFDSLSLKTIQRSKDKLEEGKERDQTYHYHQFQFNQQSYFHQGTDKYTNLSAVEYLNTATRHLDSFYLLTKLHHACEMLTLQRLHGEDLVVDFPNEVIWLAQNQAAQGNILIQIYLLIIELFQRPDMQRYTQLKQLIFSHLRYMHREGQHQFFTLLLNIANLSTDSDQRLPEMFTLYKEGLTYNLCQENGYFRADHFNSIITIACALGKFSWVESFINQYVQQLDNRHDQRRNIKHLFEATLLFWQGQHPKVIRKLRKLDFEDFTYGLRKHNLLVRSVYEVDRHSPTPDLDLPTLCDSYKIYVHRKFKGHYIGAEIRDAHLWFIRMLKKLQHCSASRYSRYSKAELRAELRELRYIAARQWLQQQLEIL